MIEKKLIKGLNRIKDEIIFQTMSTLVICSKLGHKFIGIELNPEYCKIVRSRIKAAGEVNNHRMKANKRICKDCQHIEFIGRDDYPYCYEMFRLGWGIRKIPDINSIHELCPLRANKKGRID